MAGPEGRGRPPWCAATCLRVLIVALGLARAQRADYCCRRLLWTPDWCLSPDCLGLGCAGKNAQAGFRCADIGSCICSSIVPYSTLAFCTVVSSCRLAKDDLDFAKVCAWARADQFRW